MIEFDIVTIFPKIFDSYLRESIIARAIKKKIIKIKVINLRDFTKDKRKTVDDKPYGGGIGMVIKVEPVFKAVASLKRSKDKSTKSRVILFTPRGKKFNQKMAYRLSKFKKLILICGRYEGIDERVARYIADEKISMGDYILMGGEVSAMALIESVSRLIPGVLGNSRILKERIPYPKRGFLEYPYYTRPEVFIPKKEIRWRVPKVLLSGDHKKIAQWRKKHQKLVE